LASEHQKKKEKRSKAAASLGVAMCDVPAITPENVLNYRLLGFSLRETATHFQTTRRTIKYELRTAAAENPEYDVDWLLARWPSVRPRTPMSVETRLKLNIANTGYEHTDTAKQKMSAAKQGKPTWMKGKQHTEQAKKIIGAKGKGRPSPMTGKQHTQEANEANRQKHLGFKHSNEAKTKISEAGRSRGELFTYRGVTRSVPEWAEYIGLSQSALYSRLQRMPIEQALAATKLPRASTRKSVVAPDGRMFASRWEAAEAEGVSAAAIWARIKTGAWRYR
jgi:predicted DNA-binding protein YlxM (UPF0122 family)